MIYPTVSCHVPGDWQGRPTLSCFSLVRSSGSEALVLLVVAVTAPRRRHHLPQELLHAVVQGYLEDSQK